MFRSLWLVFGYSVLCAQLRGETDRQVGRFASDLVNSHINVICVVIEIMTRNASQKETVKHFFVGNKITLSPSRCSYRLQLTTNTESPALSLTAAQCSLQATDKTRGS